jgi:hypothetical protein
MILNRLPQQFQHPLRFIGEQIPVRLHGLVLGRTCASPHSVSTTWGITDGNSADTSADTATRTVSLAASIANPEMTAWIPRLGAVIHS